MWLVLWCVLLVEVLDILCSGLVGVGQGVWKSKKNRRDCYCQTG